MSKNPFYGVDNIDAEFMERWLGGSKINSLSPKFLFDIQQLIKHYASIIVPNQDVKISFPTDEEHSPRASVEYSEIEIPTSLLIQGRVDDTIGAMIHELHHIKMSDKETNIWLSCFNLVCKILDTLFVDGGDGNYTSLYDLVMGDSTLTFDEVMSSDSTNVNANFLRKACDDVAFFLNVVEDIRIDANTPPNLKKYIDKMDKKAWEGFRPKYEAGEFSDDDDFFSVMYRLLFHHKGFIEDDYIENKSISTRAIVEGTPKQNAAKFFKSFGEDLRKHIEALYQQKGDESSDSSSNEKLVELSGGEWVGTRDIMDIYFSENAKDSLKELINTQFEGESNHFADSVSYEDREIENRPRMKCNNRDFSSVIDSSRGKPVPICPEFELEIESYKNIKIHNTTENFYRRGFPPVEEDSIEYSCVFVDYA